MVRIIGIIILVIFIGLAILSYWLIRRKKHKDFVLRQREKLTYWYLDMIPIVFLIAGLMVLLFVVI